MIKKFKRAIGLSYSGDEQLAPAVTIKGDALDADEIVALAERYGVPVVERKQLVQALELIEVGAEIPPSLYRAVALVLSELEKTHR